MTSKIEKDLSDDFDSILKYSNRGELIDFIKRFECDSNINKAFIYWHDADELFNIFRDCFVNIAAAGGVVYNQTREYYLGIERRGFFDLPKGKLEDGENFEEAAVREVEEECGIKGVSILGLLLTTYHIYREKGDLILKETRWYKMVYNQDASPSPQVEEDISKVYWVKKGNITSGLPVYPLVLDVLARSNTK
ncbi:NUDIX domain-containing protein [Marinilabiliaceae bacterium ANBcel2]|nr:NUDIX domain-containing protein [Marinilabiliaceae bacterium ANBcel2]